MHTLKFLFPPFLLPSLNSFSFYDHRKLPIFSSLPNPKPVILSKSSPDPIPPQNGFEPESDSDSADFEDGFEMEMEKVGKKNRRVIRSRIRVDADLETVWGVLTDYEGLADFIPGLAVSKLVEKGEKFARLYQVGRQDLALGLKFDAKGVVDCYERDVEYLPSGRRRDIEFKMIEGDFQIFDGRWSIEQIDDSREFQTTLFYVVELEPKLWFPVHLLEGRICKEIKSNLVSVRDQAQRVQKMGIDSLSTTLTGEDNPDLDGGS